MPQANSNRMSLTYTPEATWGVPVPATKRQDLRLTGESLAHQKNTIQSAEIRADGQVPDLIEVGASAGGNINIELSQTAYTAAISPPKEYDYLLANLMRDAWVDKAVATYSVTITTTHTISATNIHVNLVVGQWIRMTGASLNAANVGFFRVATVATGVITVEETLVNEGPIANVSIDASRLRNGLTEGSFTLERAFNDLSSLHFHAFPGCEVNTWQFTIQADQIATAVLGIVGKEELTPTSATFSSAGAADGVSATDVYNATSNVGAVLEGSPLVALTTALQGLEFTINTNRQGRRAIKSRGAVGLRQGRIIVTGTITAYFESGALLQKMIAHTASGLHTRLHTNPSAPTAGYSLLMTMPRLKFAAGDPNAGAVDTDVTQRVGFQAIRDPATGCTLQFDRFVYPAV